MKNTEKDIPYKKPNYAYIHKQIIAVASIASMFKEYVDSCDGITEKAYGRTQFGKYYYEYVDSLEEENTAEDENVNKVLEAYGISESDFDEPEDDIEDDKFSEYEKEYENKPSFEKRPKTKKKSQLEKF